MHSSSLTTDGSFITGEYGGGYWTPKSPESTAQHIGTGESNLAPPQHRFAAVYH